MRATAGTERGGVTVGAVLRAAAARLRAAGVETARLDAEVLLAGVLAVERWRLLADAQETVPPAAAAAFEGLLGRREAREPVAYILGRKEFWSLELAVTPDVLIPRPETECLVEAAVRWLRTRTATVPSPESRALRRATRDPGPGTRDRLVVVDVGTGPGTIVLAVASEVEGHRYLGTDVSAAALALARRNAAALGLAGRVELAQGDLCGPLAGRGLEGQVDLLVSNPPYVATRDMGGLAPEIRRYEPALALHGGPDGLDVIRRLVAQAPHWIAPGGALLFEFGDGQARACLDLLRQTGAYAPGHIVRDLGGRPRAVLAHRRGPESRVPGPESPDAALWTQDAGLRTRDRERGDG
ncbi:MAG TPA: peptide chain release factor N(5)-glutamine methyltransferase [Candidatus Sulfotelmatobacter sp.]|nr:peptide chain release factor N(5)-glutamine methyltransferase [Candidatus Sulfotelmatobacter sp.]